MPLWLLNGLLQTGEVCVQCWGALEVSHVDCAILHTDKIVSSEGVGCLVRGCSELGSLVIDVCLLVGLLSGLIYLNKWYVGNTTCWQGALRVWGLCIRGIGFRVCLP